MSNWAEKSQKFSDMLKLRTVPLAYKSLKKAEELDTIPGVTRWPETCSWCQTPYKARAMGLTIGITSEDKMYNRCQRICGLASTNEEKMNYESEMLATTWMPSQEEGMKQQRAYPRIPAGEAIVIGPMATAEYDPDVILIFGNPAQMMMIMCGMQKVKYERFDFSFIGEGACADSLAQCYNSGKPALSIPCYGERAFGQVADDELILALPPSEVDRALQGLEMLSKVGFIYPPLMIGGTVDPDALAKQLYPGYEI